MARDLPTPDPRVGTIIADRYRIDSLLGEGGMGKVYAAEHVLMRKRLAVKVLHRELTTVPEVVARFEREAMAAANIDHPNVAAATDFGKLPDGSVFLVLEYVEGRNLRDEIAKGPLEVERAVSIARQIASALGSAHSRDIVHRDLKPENVMLVSKTMEPDFVKVLDFGIAKVPIGESAGAAGSAITKIGMVFGTPEYMSPEQALGQTVDGRADLYALGVIFYEMLAGLRPYSSNNQVGILGQQLSKPIPSLGDRVPGISIPPAVEQVVRILLARDANERYQTAVDAVTALEGLLGLPVAGAPRLFTQLGGSIPAPLAPPSSPNLESPAVPGGMDAYPSLADVSPSSRQGSWGASSASTLSDEATLALAGKPLKPLASLSTGEREPSAKRVIRELRNRLQGGLNQIRRRSEAIHRHLPPQLRGIPLAVYWMGAGLLLVLTSAGLVVALGTPRRGGSHGAVRAESVDAAVPSGGVRIGTADAAPSASTSDQAATVPAASPSSPTMDELELAKREGSSGVARLAGLYPKSGRVLLELARVQRAEKKDRESLQTVTKALELDPKLRDDAELRELLLAEARNEGMLEASFTLLEKNMGPRGADLIYELLIQKDATAAAKERAQKYLVSADYTKVASPELQITVKLYQAKDAREVGSLLDEARQHGDQRTIDRLHQFEQRQICLKFRKRRGCVRSAPFLDGLTLQRTRATVDDIQKRLQK